MEQTVLPQALVPESHALAAFENVPLIMMFIPSAAGPCHDALAVSFAMLPLALVPGMESARMCYDGNFTSRVDRDACRPRPSAINVGECTQPVALAVAPCAFVGPVRVDLCALCHARQTACAKNKKGRESRPAGAARSITHAWRGGQRRRALEAPAARPPAMRAGEPPSSVPLSHLILTLLARSPLPRLLSPHSGEVTAFSRMRHACPQQACPTFPVSLALPLHARFPVWTGL